MEIRAYVINEQRRLERFAASELSATWMEDPVARWIDIEAESPDELRAALRELELHPLVLENLLEPPDGSRVATYAQALYVHFPHFGASATGMRAYVSMVCLPTLLITARSSSGPDSRHTVFLVDDELLLESSAHAVFYALVERLVRRGRSEWERVREQVARLSRLIDEKPHAIESGRIMDCKESVDRLSRMCEDQLQCVRLLRSAETQMSPASTLREHFRDLADDLRAAQDAVARLETRVRDLRQEYALALQHVMNRRLSFLAVLSAAFLPSTLIAGIFGMNFSNMPALEMRYGYFVALAIMLLLVVVQFAYFWRRRWF